MNETDRPRRWFRPWRDEPQPAAEDPADLGTAFGLDLSLQRDPDASAATSAADACWLPHPAPYRHHG